jgi:hypothetical protein
MAEAFEMATRGLGSEDGSGRPGGRVQVERENRCAGGRRAVGAQPRCQAPGWAGAATAPASTTRSASTDRSELLGCVALRRGHGALGVKAAAALGTQGGGGG